ncbi:MAG: hypothetical protein HYX84_05465 [Chloroflexi bacterium]|nr:hypothetical protein [Chloroflexota bacterium]
MSPEIKAIVLLLHLIAMLFMAAPLYLLVVVNERARFTVPPGYNTDRYMENIIKNQPARCYAYLAVILVTGVLLVWSRGWVWASWALIAKLVVFTVLTTLLSYVHFTIQPQIEKTIGNLKPGQEVPANQRPGLVALRTRRKRLSATCLFFVLSGLIFGVTLSWSLAPWVTAVFIILAALFAWRAFRKPIPLGWF